MLLPFLLGIMFLVSLQAATVQIDVLKDTSLFETGPDANLGADDLASGTTKAGYKSRALIQFDVASLIPTGSTIQSVSLRLNVNRQANGAYLENYGLHKFLTNWTEGVGTSNFAPALTGETSWNSQSQGSVLWSTPGTQSGVEYSPVISGLSATILTTGTFNISSTSQMVTDVQSWLDAPTANFGWMIIGQREDIGGTARRFTSKETGALVPQITVTYAVPEPSISGLLILSSLAMAYLRRHHFQIPGSRGVFFPSSVNPTL
jgi:hypothetical protein